MQRNFHSRSNDLDTLTVKVHHLESVVVVKLSSLLETPEFFLFSLSLDTADQPKRPRSELSIIVVAI